MSAWAQALDQGRVEGVNRELPKAIAMQDALERVLSAAHQSHCAVPFGVAIQLASRSWIVSFEWQDQAKNSKWSVDVDTGRITPGPCVVAERPQPVGRLLAFARAVRAAAKKTPLYQSDPEHFVIRVGWTEMHKCWQVEFSPADQKMFGGGAMARVDGSFRVLASKLTQ